MPERSSSLNTQRQKTIRNWESAWITIRGHGFRCVIPDMPHQSRKLRTETKIHPHTHTHTHTNTHTHTPESYGVTNAFLFVLCSAKDFTVFCYLPLQENSPLLAPLRQRIIAKGLGLLILHLFSHLGERLHVRPPSPPTHISLTKPYP